MKKRYWFAIIAGCLVVALTVPTIILANQYKKHPSKPYDYVLHRKETFKIVNFADVHVQTSDDLKEGTLMDRTIRKAIKDEKPNMITFSGDNVDSWTNGPLYVEFCDYMDQFGIDYYVIFGNHERAVNNLENNFEAINNSKYGHMERGTVEGVFPNYFVNIRNWKNQVIHKVIMMDCRYLKKYDESLYVPITEKVPGVVYDKKLTVYGDPDYDGIRDEQIDWYKEILKYFNKESTLIIHYPLMEFAFAIEDYYRALNSGNQELVDSFEAIDPDRMYQFVNGCPVNFGFFDIIKDIGSTKNVIAGHSHLNCYSVLYKGVRLSFAVKTGDKGGTHPNLINGYTSLTIDQKGHAKLENHNILDTFE